MASELSEDALKWVSKLERASEDVNQDPSSPSVNYHLADTLQSLAKVVLDGQQRCVLCIILN